MIAIPDTGSGLERWPPLAVAVADSMIAIPDTGSGLSGFLAHYLWLVYQYFPFEGTWDWLVLFLLLGGGVHFTFLPYVWKLVEGDIHCLQKVQADYGGPIQGRAGASWGFACLLFFSWFFSTTAGRTLLDGRSFFGNAALTGVDRRVYWVSLVVLYALVGLLCTISILNRDTEAGSEMKIESFKSVTLWEGMCFAVAHLYYWYWSCASLTLMYCFLLSAILTDCVRMLFVYTLHKRTFG